MRALKELSFRTNVRNLRVLISLAIKISPLGRNDNKMNCDTLSRGLRGISLGKGGFTLLEILIAIAIMSIILVALYSTYLLAHKALFDVDKSLVKLQEARAFADILKREIESTLYSQANSYCVFKMDDRDFYGKQASSLT